MDGKSWEEGNEEAALFLGKLYEGTVDTDMEMAPAPEKARLWFEKAASKGNGEALAELAFFYEKGITLPKDSKKQQTFSKMPWAMAMTKPFSPWPFITWTKKKRTRPCHTWKPPLPKGKRGPSTWQA